MKKITTTIKKKQTYNELINYLENDQPVINILIEQLHVLRNCPYLSQFDNGSLIDLEEQEREIEK
jgi:SLT domain-containing protein